MLIHKSSPDHKGNCPSVDMSAGCSVTPIVAPREALEVATGALTAGAPGTCSSSPGRVGQHRWSPRIHWRAASVILK